MTLAWSWLQRCFLEHSCKCCALAPFWLSNLLTNVVLARVHTFGFSIPAVSGADFSRYVCHGIGTFVLKPTAKAIQLANLVPNLQTFKVLYSAKLHFCDERVDGVVCLRAWFMTAKLFPKLRSVTCFCQHLKLQLRGLSPWCHVVFKFQSAEWHGCLSTFEIANIYVWHCVDSIAQIPLELLMVTNYMFLVICSCHSRISRPCLPNGGYCV